MFLPNKHFRVTQGKEDELTTYEFGSKTMPHKVSCRLCDAGKESADKRSFAQFVEQV